MPMDFALFAQLSGVQRCEYLDGAMYGSPSPSPAHQHAVLRVARALENYFAMRDREALVLVGPVAVFLDEDSVAQPDVLVVKRRQLSARGVEGPPQLIVEIATAESADRDRDVKVRAYGAAGVERYWVIDLDRRSVECRGPLPLPGSAGVSISGNVLTVDGLPGFELRMDTLWPEPSGTARIRGTRE
jgi:Uma2 family endonuclease